MTSSIARMNCFLHGIEDFRIERGDTLSAPKFVEGDRLQRFDVALANPPYSIKQWDRDAFGSDPWGRNLYGTPPQGRADYASGSTSFAASRPKRAAAPFSSRMGSCSDRRKPRCGASSSKPT
jgi:type I restriction enzyme M protein